LDGRAVDEEAARHSARTCSRRVAAPGAPRGPAALCGIASGLAAIDLDRLSACWATVPTGDYDSEAMAITEEALIDQAGRRLAAAAPDADIILFGSRARGEARSDSDLDLLVIEPDFDRRGEEYGRLRKELRGLDVAIDLVIYRKREVEKWRDVPGSFLHRALGEGRVLAGP
jgi:predicted nucleotidyltransferase